MAIPQPPGQEWLGGNRLQYISDALFVVISWLDALGETIADVYLLGEWLSAPFRYGSTLITEVQNYVDQLGNAISYLFGWVEYIVWGDGFYWLLYVLWEGVVDFLEQPVTWILDTLWSIYDWVYDFFDDPIGFITSLVSFILSEIEEFIADPLGYIESVVRYIFPLLEFFWDDPIGFILEQLAFLYSWLYDFLIDPLAFILQLIGYEISHWYDFLYFPVDWIISLLGEFSNEVYEFLQDPFGYVYSIVQGLLGDITFDPFEVGLALLEQLIQIAIDNLLWVIDSLEELIVEFIVERL